jgi:hypothetical protein
VNRYQKILLIVAVFNLAVIILFPPFDAEPLLRSASRTFDGFYYVFGYHVNRVVNVSLLHIEVILIAANVGVAWLLLIGGNSALPGPETIRGHRYGILAMMGVNLALMLLFPPMEGYSSLTRMQPTSFDGFYFMFGDKSGRNVFIPILYMEVSFVLINAALFWLLFGESERAGRDLAPEQVSALAQKLAPEHARKLADELQQKLSQESRLASRSQGTPPGAGERRKRPRN